jgi:hypothetical protein
MSAKDSAPPQAASSPTGARAVVAAPSQTWIVAAGETIDGQWRVDSVDVESLRLTYLPLGMTQTVPLKAN